MARQTTKVDAIIIGAGFAGCYALYRLRQLGLSVKIVDSGSDFGGVWHWNRYPGARVDGDSSVYQLSIPEVWKDWDWTERFSCGDDLRRYFQHVDQVLDLRKDTIFDSTVIQCQYDDVTKEWTVSFEQGWHVVCQYLICASGATSDIYTPDIPGLDRFQGVVAHPARYPSDLDVRGKRVGIIGNGSSGVQLVEALAKQVTQLTVFVRTPCVAIPMRQHRVSTGESATQKSFAEAVFEKCRRSESFCGYNSGQGSVHQFSKAKQRALLDEVWRRGDWNILLSSFSDYAVDETANSIIYDYWVERVRARMTDPEKMEIVAPLKQTNWWGTKRPCLEQDYYEIINDPKVIVHDLKRAPIKEVTPNVLITKSGTTEEQHHLDVIILATGYDALTGSLLRLGLHDRHGTPLQEKWRDGTVTYLGLMIPGMPNMFMINGPQTPASLTCGPPFMEQQVDWICGMITAMRARDVACVDATEQAAKKWQQEVYAAAERTLHVRADSWWMGANIPCKRREPLVYFGGSQQWLKRSLCVLEGWGGLTVA